MFKLSLPKGDLLFYSRAWSFWADLIVFEQKEGVMIKIITSSPSDFSWLIDLSPQLCHKNKMYVFRKYFHSSVHPLLLEDIIVRKSHKVLLLAFISACVTLDASAALVLSLLSSFCFCNRVLCADASLFDANLPAVLRILHCFALLLLSCVLCPHGVCRLHPRRWYHVYP